MWDHWLRDDDRADEVLEAIGEQYHATAVSYRPVSRKMNRPGVEGEEVWDRPERQDLPCRDRSPRI